DYASPEQKRDAKAADHRSDIYSLGATMYHMLTGETPRTIRSDRLPPELDQVVLKCLEERPEDRYFSVDELLADLEKAASGKGAAPRKKVVIEEEPEGTCVACWYLNKPEARFCKKCGAGLFEPCVRCKKEIRAGSEHCIHCGVDVPKARKMAEHLAQAMEHLGGKRYDRALKELSLLLAIEPKNTEALRLHGEASQSQDEAKRFREEAEGFIKAEEYERAQKVLEEYLVLAPEDAEARKLLEELPGKIVERDCARAEALEKDGKVQLALGLYEAVLSREPQNEKARAAATRIRARKAAEHLAQAKEHLEGRRYGRALKELDLLLELEPKSPEAVALRKEVIHKKHEEARALRDLADGHVKAAQHERAQKALEEYLALVPEDIDARKLLAELPGKIVERRECARAEALELDGKAQLALGIYEGVLSTEPQNEKARAASRRIQAQLARSRRRVMLVMATAAAGLLVAGLLGYQLMGNGERARRDETSVFAPEATPAGHPTPTPSGTATRPGEAFTNTLGMKLVLIPPGEYLMGSPPGEEGRDGDESQHRVKITRPFYLGVTEVTQAQWRAVMKTDPSHFKGDKLPVEQISWEDAKAFCQKLSEREGKKYRLPTEAEWEYACRAGTTTPYYTGLTIGGEHANYDGERTRPVSRFSANAWGLYDMHGNVFEWCQDWFGPYPPGDVVDPDGPASGNSRVLRGGSWDKQEWISRSADRRHWEPGIRRSFLGFRVALDF
ncbi:MAG: SUMF1/EgtB/PvdO family nonheme iron enzyme, partial [Planctomycetes bacterium]|nr:SUMF1/EgtB/PvdO family nonheme iron enzyme [Planctomycetota bacterium]